MSPAHHATFGTAQTVLPRGAEDGLAVGAHRRRRRTHREAPIAILATATPAPACFGVVCPEHARCQRYHAVVGTAADPRTIVTCRVGDRFPLFLVCVPIQAMAA